MMFALPLVSLSIMREQGPPLWFSEFVATFGLMLIIRMLAALSRIGYPIAVACYITGGVLVYGVHIVCEPRCHHRRAR